jgi:hypothetical protein
MTAPAWLRALSDRCSVCGCHPVAQGHIAPCAPSGPLGLKLAEEAKAQAFSRLDASDRTDESALLRRSIIALGHRKSEFSPDDLPAEVRESTNPNRRGRVFSELLEKGVIREVGRRKSANPRAHGKQVGIYQLVIAA